MLFNIKLPLVYDKDSLFDGPLMWMHSFSAVFMLTQLVCCHFITSFLLVSLGWAKVLQISIMVCGM